MKTGRRAGRPVWLSVLLVNRPPDLFAGQTVKPTSIRFSCPNIHPTRPGRFCLPAGQARGKPFRTYVDIFGDHLCFSVSSVEA